MPPEKRPQVKFYLSPEQYEKLKANAAEQGLTIPAVVKRLTLEYLGETNGGGFLARYKELESKQKQLATEMGRLERDHAIISKKLQEFQAKQRTSGSSLG